MARMKSHPNALPAPTIKQGDNPKHTEEIARLWVPGTTARDLTIDAITRSDNPELYAWIIGRLAEDIAEHLAIMYEADQASTKAQLTDHLLLNLPGPERTEAEALIAKRKRTHRQRKPKY
jgi:hypothetical protein